MYTAIERPSPPHTRTPAAVSSAASARLACREYQEHPPHAPLPARRLLAAARTPKVAMPVGLQPAVRRWERLPSRSSPLRRFASLFSSARAARSMSLCRTPSPYTAISLRVRDLALSAGRAATPPRPYSTRIIHTPSPPRGQGSPNLTRYLAKPARQTPKTSCHLPNLSNCAQNYENLAFFSRFNSVMRRASPFWAGRLAARGD